MTTTSNSVRSIAAVAVLSLSALALPRIVSVSQAWAKDQVAQNDSNGKRFSSERGSNGVRGPHGHCGVGCQNAHNGA
jgi:hypothetical protein